MEIKYIFIIQQLPNKVRAIYVHYWIPLYNKSQRAYVFQHHVTFCAVIHRFT